MESPTLQLNLIRKSVEADLQNEDNFDIIEEELVE